MIFNAARAVGAFLSLGAFPSPGVFLALGAALGATAIGFGPEAARAEAFNPAAINREVIQRTNSYRRDQGLRPLRRDAALARAAQAYAEYYAANPGRPALWGHEYGGLNPADRAQNAGFQARCVGENLGWQGTSGAVASLGDISAKMLAGWIDSRTHRRNLEDRQFRVIGVGAARFRADGLNWVVAVQMFGCEPYPR